MRLTALPFSKILIPVIVVVLVLTYYLHPFTNVLAWDVFGYYLYLPAYFIYGDLALKDQSWLQTILDTYHNTPVLCQAQLAENGNYVMVYNMGLALLNLPFFLAAHGITPLTGYPADGFSYPYQLAIMISAQVYMVMGLIFWRKILKRFFTEIQTVVIMLLIVFGTNYFHLNTHGITLTHSYLFSLAAVFMWSLLRWEETHKYKYICFIGISGGLMTLIRPTEVVIFLLFLLWGVKNKSALRERIRLFLKYKKQIILMFLVFLLVLLPQFIYWKILTGSWYYYAHPAGAVLDLLSPHLHEVLFSFRKGWLIYTPMMLFALIGFFYLYRHLKVAFIGVLVYFIIHLYIVSSWSCWWYGGGDFSNRALLSSYLILSLPLGFFVKDILSRKIRYLFVFLFAALMALNLFQTWQFHHGIIHGDRMTMKYYFKIFGKTKVNSEYEKYLLVDRTVNYTEDLKEKEKYQHKIIKYWDFENPQGNDKDYYTDDTCISGSYAFKLNAEKQYSPGLVMPYKEITDREYAWVGASVWIYIPKDFTGELPCLVSTFSHKKTVYAYRTVCLSSDSVRPDSWNYLKMYNMTPEVISKSDKLYIYVWNRSESPVFVDDLKVEVYQPF